MPMIPIAQCGKSLDFKPVPPWPSALPALAWRGELLSGFQRKSGVAVDLFETQAATFTEAIKATHPELNLCELARLAFALKKTWPDLFVEVREPLFQSYGFRWNERLEQTLGVLKDSPEDFQAWAGEKDLGPRDFSVLLALSSPKDFHPFLSAMTELSLSRSEGVRAMEIGAELYMMGRPLNDILPSGHSGPSYLQQLEKWRRPNTLSADDQWRETVKTWPWPSQVQGKWQRFGDQSGLDVNIRSTSPSDFRKKLERLLSIGDTWYDRSQS
jgi:hypothetical protein